MKRTQRLAELEHASPPAPVWQQDGEDIMAMTTGIINGTVKVTESSSEWAKAVYAQLQKAVSGEDKAFARLNAINMAAAMAKQQRPVVQKVHVGDVHDNRGTTVNNYFISDVRERAVFAIGRSDGAVTVEFLMKQLCMTDRKEMADALLHEWFDWQPKKGRVGLTADGKRELTILNAAANGEAE